MHSAPCKVQGFTSNSRIVSMTKGATPHQERDFQRNARKWTRKRISYDFKSTEQLFSPEVVTQADLPIRSFLAGHHRGVESWEVTGGVAKTWTRHATTMRFGFLGFEFMPGMYDMHMWCHTCHTFKWRTTHVYCVLSTLMYAMKLLPDWKLMKLQLFYWMMRRPNNEKLKRCVTKTKHHNMLSYRSQFTILYTLHFTHLRMENAFPSFMTRLRIAL